MSEPDQPADEITLGTPAFDAPPMAQIASMAPIADASASVPLSPPPGPPRVWPVFVAVASALPVMFGVWIVAFAVWFVVSPPPGNLSAEQSQARIQDAIKNPLFLIPVLIVISIGNFGISMSGGFLSPLKPRRRLGLQPGIAGWVALILLAIGTLAAGTAAINIVQLIGIHANQGTNQLLTDMARNATRTQYITLLVVVSVFPAIAEELLFRGYAQTRLVARWGSLAGILISAIMFGLIHMDPVQTPDMILLGSYLGWTAYRTGSTRTSIFCHLVNNLAAIGLSAIASSGKIDEPNTKMRMLMMILIGSAVCALCTWIATRVMPPRAKLA